MHRNPGFAFNVDQKNLPYSTKHRCSH